MAQHSQLRCPRCAHQLFVGQTHSAAVHGCGHCGGVWLDATTSQRVVDTVCEATLELARKAGDHGQAKIDTTEQHNLRCPQCSEPMRTERVQNAWLDVDRCQTHGVWYDRGELERVARAAKQQLKDWRVTPLAAAPAMAAAAAAPAVVDTATSTGSEVAAEFATEVAAELAFEGIFALLSALFD